MAAVEQGDLLKVQGIAQPVIVVSNNFFNQSGMAILCPIGQRAFPSPLHIELHDAPVEGFYDVFGSDHCPVMIEIE